MCVVCLEKEKKKSFTMELVQQQYVCGVFREREKKSFAMELVLQHFLLSIYAWLLKFWDLGSSHYLNGFMLGPYLFKD